MSIWNCYLFIALLGYTYAKLNMEKLENELQKLEEQALGVSKIQDHYDRNLEYEKSSVNGPALLKEVTKTLESQFEKLVNAAEKIEKEVVKNYHTFPSTVPAGMQECCKATNVKDSLKFLSKVNTDGACVTQATTSSKDKIFPDGTVEKVMKDNYVSNPSLLWQYFGSEGGTSIYYPKVKVEGCTDFDPRFQQFYASAATPEPKDVVVVIDTSGSMSTERNGASRLSIAKEAARTVVNTLGPDDRIGIVAYSNEAKTPKITDTGKIGINCYENTLSVATTENKNTLITFVNKLNTEHKSNFAAGLRKAFEYFKKSAKSINGESRHRVILFLTDGTDYDGDDPLIVIRDKNHELNNSVVIMTYGIGTKETIDSNSLLKNMSRQIYNNPSYGTIRVGTTTYIEDQTNLRSNMGSYYNFFKTQNTKPVFSVPFVDIFSRIGLVISICFQAYDTKLLGVACADVKLSDLFSKVTVFGEGEHSYVFIIDRTGRTLFHPLLPLSRTIKNNHPLLDISFLERENEAKAVIDSMKRGEGGNATFQSIRTVARGVVNNEGIQTKTILSHYYWNPIPKSDYSLCVVVGEGDKEQTLTTQSSSEDIFLYHLEKNIRRPCKNFKRRATKENSKVKFNPSAFKDPSRYLDREETETDIQNYKKYFTGTGSNVSGFKSNVKNSIIATHFAEKFWKDSSAIDTFVIWRYIGTKDGFIRVYPGVELLKGYDHELRPWWRRTISQTGTLVLTTPYVDAWGAGYLISMCKTIYKGSSSEHTVEDKIEAVVGADLPLTYLYHLLVQTNPNCDDSQYSCMLIDTSGFIVIHKDFVSPWFNEESRFIETVHIVSKEPNIANDLASKGIMSKKSCIDIDNHKIQQTYIVRLTLQYQEGVDQLESVGHIQYELRPVSKTNLFMVIKKQQQKSSSCCRNLPMHAADVTKCSDPQSPCECLCYKDVTFNVCTNNVELSDAGATCIAKTPDTSGSSSPETVDGLPVCFDSQCASRSSEFNCYKVAGCAWCVRNKAGKVFPNQCCRATESCEFGIVPIAENVCTVPTSNTPTKNETIGNTQKEAITLPVVGGVLGGIVVVLTVAVIMLLCRKKLLKQHPNPAGDYLTPIPEMNSTMGPTNPAYNAETFAKPPPYSAEDGYPLPHRHMDVDRYNSLPNSSNSSNSNTNTQGQTF